jgi:hypothetical protein
MEEERSHLICTLASRNERDLMESLLTYSPLCGGMLEYLERIPSSKLVNLLGPDRLSYWTYSQISNHARTIVILGLCV